LLPSVWIVSLLVGFFCLLCFFENPTWRSLRCLSSSTGGCACLTRQPFLAGGILTTVRPCFFTHTVSPPTDLLAKGPTLDPPFYGFGCNFLPGYPPDPAISVLIAVYFGSVRAFIYRGFFKRDFLGPDTPSVGLPHCSNVLSFFSFFCKARDTRGPYLYSPPEVK